MRLLFGVDSRKGTLNTRNPFTLKLSYLFFMFMRKKKKTPAILSTWSFSKKAGASWALVVLVRRVQCCDL